MSGWYRSYRVGPGARKIVMSYAIFKTLQVQYRINTQEDTNPGDFPSRFSPKRNEGEGAQRNKQNMAAFEEYRSRDQYIDASFRAFFHSYHSRERSTWKFVRTEACYHACVLCGYNPHLHAVDKRRQELAVFNRSSHRACHLLVFNKNKCFTKICQLSAVSSTGRSSG